MTRMLKLTGIVFITFQLSLAQARTSNKPEPCNIPEKTVMRTEGSVAGYQIEFIPYKHHAVLQFQHSTQEYTIVIPLGHPPRHEGKPHHGRPHHGKPHHGRPHHGKPHHGKPHHGRPHHGNKPHPGRPSHHRSHHPVACNGNVLKWEWEETTPVGLSGKIEVVYDPESKEMHGTSKIKSSATEEGITIKMTPYVH